MPGVCRLSLGLPHLIGRFSARLLRQMGCSAFSKVRAIASLPTTMTTFTRPISVARLCASGSTAAICRNVPHSILVHAHDTIRISSPSSRSHDCADEHVCNASVSCRKCFPSGVQALPMDRAFADRTTTAGVWKHKMALAAKTSAGPARSC